MLTGSMISCLKPQEVTEYSSSDIEESPQNFQLADVRSKLLPLKIISQKLKLFASFEPEKWEPIQNFISLNRTNMGDSSYADGVQPGDKYEFLKTTLLIKVSFDICSQPEVMERPVEAIWEMAVGRHPNEVESTHIGNLPEEHKIKLACIAILAAPEFVMR